MIKTQIGFNHRGQGRGRPGMSDIGLYRTDTAGAVGLRKKLVQCSGFQVVLRPITAAVSFHKTDRRRLKTGILKAVFQ